jgi:hypothetical protein
MNINTLQPGDLLLMEKECVQLDLSGYREFFNKNKKQGLYYISQPNEFMTVLKNDNRCDYYFLTVLTMNGVRVVVSEEKEYGAEYFEISYELISRV